MCVYGEAAMPWCRTLPHQWDCRGFMVELIVICFCCVSRGDSVMWCSPVVLVLVLVLVSAAQHQIA
jgi:hypothetical protein